MDPEKKKSIKYYVSKKWTELKSKNDILNQWFLINGETVFSFMFWVHLQSIAEFKVQQKPLILEILKKKCVSVKFWSRSCLYLSNYKLYISSGSFCHPCCERLCFYVINNYFNSIGKSFIVNGRKFTKSWFNVL